MFVKTLHVGSPNFGRREQLIKRINEVLDRRWLTNHGPMVQEFERRISDLVGVKHCVAMCNATVALEIAIKAMGMTGEVIVPSYTFVATAHALQWHGIRPIFCDIDSLTHNIDPDKVERAITPNTTGILAVHLWGRACNIEALTNIARKHQLGLVFDAAHAFGCSQNGLMIGQFGNAEVFSFHATKFINSFEGGAIATNDDDLAAQARLMRNFGFSGHDNVVSIGTNGKMSEMSAAMGLTALESMDYFVDINYRNYCLYRQHLEGIPGIQLISYNEEEINNYQYIVVEIDDHMAGITRDQIIEILHAENILARRYFYPGCHQMEPYRSALIDRAIDLRETELVANRVLVLPTGTTVEPFEISGICDVIKLAMTKGPEVQNRLKVSDFEEAPSEHI